MDGLGKCNGCAFNHNVEFGINDSPKNKFGIDAFMGAEDSSDGFRNMLVPHSIENHWSLILKRAL